MASTLDWLVGRQEEESTQGGARRQDHAAKPPSFLPVFLPLLPRVAQKPHPGHLGQAREHLDAAHAARLERRAAARLAQQVDLVDQHERDLVVDGGVVRWGWCPVSGYACVWVGGRGQRRWADAPCLDRMHNDKISRLTSPRKPAAPASLARRDMWSVLPLF